MADPYRFGTRSAATLVLQRALAAHGFDPGPADGVFGRENPAEAMLGKHQEAEVAGPQAVDDHRGDQETGDDEEDVDTDIAARKHLDAGVEQDDGDDGDSTQAIDIWAIAQIHASKIKSKKILSRRTPELHGTESIFTHSCRAVPGHS